jgi:hypothetical protein
MTEDEWRASTDPFRMLRLLHPRRVSARKYQLFGAACCGRAWSVLADARCRDAAIALERFADGPREPADRIALATAWGAAWPARSRAEETASYVLGQSGILGVNSGGCCARSRFMRLRRCPMTSSP